MSDSAKRIATFVWRTPPPTSVDEELALYEDGTARLVVRRPVTSAPTIGTYSFEPDRADFDGLAKAGRGPVTFDLTQPTPAGSDELFTLATSVARNARNSPEATASFYGRPVESSDRELASVSLAVVGAGRRTVEFDLDPGRCAVHLSSNGETVRWFEFPKLEIGFVTTNAEGLGGVGQRAQVKPGDWGALLVSVPNGTGVTHVAVQAAGYLYEALPDAKAGAPFEVRTEPMPISRQ